MSTLRFQAVVEASKRVPSRLPFPVSCLRSITEVCVQQNANVEVSVERNNGHRT